MQILSAEIFLAGFRSKGRLPSESAHNRSKTSENLGHSLSKFLNPLAV